MPFSIKLHLSASEPIEFLDWIESAFGPYLPKGTPFAKAESSCRRGNIVTNGPMVLKRHAMLNPGDLLKPGDYIADGMADGEAIPYGKPFCLFVEESD